jgi:hypothetical protein
MFTHSFLTIAQNFAVFALIGFLLGGGHGIGHALISLVVVRACSSPSTVIKD